jgi:hypothetical protein
MSPKATDDDASLKRLPGQGWQTRDGRFTIETASGTWSLVDAEQTDDLGLPLVRGPFRSLAEAKAAIEKARSSAPTTSVLGSRAAKQPQAKPADADEAATQAAAKTAAKKKRADEPEEPRWIAELDAPDRRRAHRLIAALAERGVRDAEGVVRRDVAGGVPAVGRLAVADRVAEILDADGADGADGAHRATAKATAQVIDALVEGRDEDLDVRWRLVDDEGRPIGLTADDLAAARKRRSARH